MSEKLKLPKPEFEFLYYIEVTCGAPITVGNSGTGVLNIIPITGGTFDGPRMRGSVLNMGADWNTTLSNGVGRVNTRYALKTDDNAVISLSTDGYFTFPVEEIKKLISNQPTDPEKYYFRQHLFFETSAEKYSWLNSIAAFAVIGLKSGRVVCYDAYMIK